MKKQKLNLGCDFDYKKGWINLDFHKGIADVVHNLNKFPYPFKDNQFDYVLAKHVIEHLDDIPKVMKEIHRISKPDAIIKIVVPYFNNFNAFRDVTHKQFFTWDSFSTFTGNPSSREKNRVGYVPVIFEYRKRKLIWGSSQNKIFNLFCKIMDFFVNLNPDFMERRFPFFITIEALDLELVVKKSPKTLK
jgi:SAM-dependent methyltransferase